MILQELTKLYRKLLENPDVDICEPGYSKENISFKIIINPNGQLIDNKNPIMDLRETDGKIVRPVKVRVPKFDGKRTSKPMPYFLWDKTDYIIGVARDANNDDPSKFIATPERNVLFVELIDTIAEATAMRPPSAMAIRKFCASTNNIDYLRSSPHWNDFLGSFVIFEVEGCPGQSVFEDPEIELMWTTYYSSLSARQESASRRCLVTGKLSASAHAHPTIKKGVGGKNDIPLVSCNLDAAESYGKHKNETAPVSIQAASAIAGALNYLVDQPKHNLTIGDTKTLFWAEANEIFSDFFADIFDRRADAGYSDDLSAFLKSVRAGRIPEEIKDTGRFFVLGLAPNAARISVRFWHVDRVESVAAHIGRHFTNLQLIPNKDNVDSEYPSIYQLLIETAALHKTENIPPNISGPLMRSILTGISYPMNILSILISRMHTDQGFNRLTYYRASFIKAILNRNFGKELTVTLDHQRSTVPYCLGRVFALLEKIQEDASGGSINTTIKDRYFSSASATPRVAFAVLIRLSHNHLKKLKSDRTGLAIFREKELGEIMGHLPPVLPATLKLEEQGEFAIGYYHQRQSFFQKKGAEVSEEKE